MKPVLQAQREDETSCQPDLAQRLMFVTSYGASSRRTQPMPRKFFELAKATPRSMGTCCWCGISSKGHGCRLLSNVCWMGATWAQMRKKLLSACVFFVKSSLSVPKYTAQSGQSRRRRRIWQALLIWCCTYQIKGWFLLTGNVPSKFGQSPTGLGSPC